MRVEHVEHKIIQRGKQPKVIWFNSMIEGSTSAANGAITNADMIQERINLELDTSTMTGALVGLFHMTGLVRVACSSDSSQPASV